MRLRRPRPDCEQLDHRHQCRLWVKDGCGRQIDGTAGVPSAPEIAGAFRTYASCHNQKFRIVGSIFLRQSVLVAVPGGTL
jgi:hypothetical protein